MHFDVFQKILSCLTLPLSLLSFQRLQFVHQKNNIHRCSGCKRMWIALIWEVTASGICLNINAESDGEIIMADGFGY